MERLTKQEGEAMQAVWRVGEGNVKHFLAQMEGLVQMEGLAQREERLTKIEGSRLPYTTLASTLKNLQKKGYLSGRLLGNAYLYKATITEDEYKKGLVSALVGDYFGDSYERLVHFCVEEKKLSVRALKELIEQIETEG